MNKSVIAAALLICLTISTLYSIQYVGIEAPKKEAVERYWQYKIDHSERNIASSPLVQSEMNESPSEGKNPRYETQDEEKRELQIADHKAQVSMRNAAWSAFVLGVIGTGLLTYTLIGTLRANKKLGKQNEIALNASKAEFQPYLDVQSLVLDFPEVWDNGMYSDGGDTVNRALFLVRGGRVHFPFTVKFSNWGKTPAQNLRFEISFKISDFETREVVYEGQEIDPTVDLIDYLTVLDGEKEFVFTSYAPIGDVTPPEGSYIDLLHRSIEVRLSVFLKDQFSDEERQYLCVFEGYCSDGEILKKSVKEITQS